VKAGGGCVRFAAHGDVPGVGGVERCDQRRLGVAREARALQVDRDGQMVQGVLAAAATDDRPER